MSEMPMPASPRAQRLVIVGAVAAGTSVGAKARRNDEEMEIVIYERDRDISYSGCGLPYFIGGTVPDADDLHPRDPAWFAKRYNIDIRTGHEVISADPAGRTRERSAAGARPPCRCGCSTVVTGSCEVRWSSSGTATKYGATGRFTNRISPSAPL